jgi:hypothetical protein
MMLVDEWSEEVVEKAIFNRKKRKIVSYVGCHLLSQQEKKPLNITMPRIHKSKVKYNNHIP